MGAEPAAGSPIDKMTNRVRQGLASLVARVKALRLAVRVDNFRLVQHLRMGLVLYLKHLGQSLRSDVARLFEVSGVWVRNAGERHQTKRQVLQVIRRIIPRLTRSSRAWETWSFSNTQLIVKPGSS